MGIWQLGNTSVRSAMRIKDGLTALSTSSIQGNIRKGEGDIAFRRLLGECGVVSLGEDPTHSVGRKWRAAMGKLGFIYPDIKADMGFTQEDLGPRDRITPAGWNLIQADTVAAIQECYLRAMVTPLFPTADSRKFSPLSWVLAILLELERRGEEPAFSFLEMALIVQTSEPDSGLAKTADHILDLRRQRFAAKNKRVFDRSIYEQAAVEIGCKAHTFVDYADMNIRYLKASGVVQAKGKGIRLLQEKHTLASELAKKPVSNKPLLELYRSLCNGTKLPTDNVTVAHQVLEELLQQVHQYGIPYSIAGKTLSTPTQINQVRFELENLIAENKEEIYAEKQREEWREIAAYMELIATRRDYCKLGDDIEIRVPKSEAPAYLEWSIWRAFLAMNSLSNKPYKLRRFKIDQDFMPISTAPGNGPDLIAEFGDYVVVIEVTLSDGSRQEAMEGEPVRRHIADLAMCSDKPVYGLFIANRIDSNTAETFRLGTWYTKEDKRLKLDIVPFTLAQFSTVFKKLFETGNGSPTKLISLMLACGTHRQHCEAPSWKNKIAETIECFAPCP